MASNLRVDSIVPATGSSVSIGTVTGGVSIPGVLTYEDVTNVDSVGVITARSGIRIGATGANTLITGNGNGIGIGTDNPSTNYRVTIKSSTSPHSALLLDTSESNYNTNLYFAKQATNKWIIGNKASDDAFRFVSGSDERLRIGSSGQLGIGGANYGTSGQVVTSQGSGSAVQWASPVIYTEYSTQTVSGANSYSITITGDPKVFEVSLFEVRHGNNANIMYRLSNSGSETSSGYYDISTYFRHDHGSNGTSRGINQGQGCLVNYAFSGVNNLMTGKAIFTKVNTGLYTFMGSYNMRFHADQSSNDQYGIKSDGHVNNTSAVTQFRIFTSNGANFTSGSINVRGIA